MPSGDEIVKVAPRFRDPGRNWSGQCEAAANNLCVQFSDDYVRSFEDATSARKASKIEGSGVGPGGNFVWMSNVWGKHPVTGRQTDFGHVAYMLPGDSGIAFMASSAVDAIRGFRALGFINIHEYLRRFSNQKVEGWSYDHGGTIIDEEEFMNAGDKEWLNAKFNNLSDRLSRLEEQAQDGDRDHDNIGRHVTDELGKLFDRLNKIITREGKGARVYQNIDTGEVILLSSIGHWWTPIGQDGAEATVNIFEDRGWSQSWADRKKLNNDSFQQMKRFHNRISLDDVPNDGSTPLFDETKKSLG